MRNFSVFILGLAAALAGCQSSQPAPPPQTVVAKPTPTVTSSGAPPDTILFTSTYGNVTFTHQKHFERVGGDCSVCHFKVFPQSREPINYKKALHRAAEASRTACAYCHAVGGSAFAADSNCIKCHVREYPK